MSFDDDMRSQMQRHTPETTDLNHGASAAEAAARKRTALVRGAAIAAVAAVIGIGTFAMLDDDTTGVATDDTTTTSEPADTTDAPGTTDSPGTTAVPSTDEPGTTIPTAPDTVGIVTVDVDGIMRINGVETAVEFTQPPAGVDPGDISVGAADGADGVLFVQTSVGVFRDGVLVHKAPDAVLHDVITTPDGPEPLITWTIPDGNTPSGPVLGWDWEPGVIPLDAEPLALSGGPVVEEKSTVLITYAFPECSRPALVLPELEPDHPILARSACYDGEIVEWSSAGHIVAARPTQEDAWTIEIWEADGDVVATTTPGAFQPRAVDVHTDASGRTEALILGTGEELVYVDVDAFLTADDPITAVSGISNPTNVVSARFVSGLETHEFRDGATPITTDPPNVGPDDPEPTVWRVARVDADDTLNVRSGPGTENPVVFELAHDAVGVLATETLAVDVDGRDWVEVYAPTTGEVADTGWVNGAFLDRIDVLDDRPCVFNGPQDHYAGTQWANDAGSQASRAAVVSNIETFRFGSCIRTVIEFADAWSYDENGANPVDTLPNDLVVRREPVPVIDFGDHIIGAEAAEFRYTESSGLAHSTFAIASSDQQLTGLLYGPTSVIVVQYDNTSGRMVIDTATTSAEQGVDPELDERLGGGSPILDDGGLVLQTVDTNDATDTWTFSGLARPFEATVGVEVLDFDDERIDVDWQGAVLEGSHSVNGVMTSSYIDGWGRFTFSIELPDGVDATSVVLRIDPTGGGIENPPKIDVPLADLLAAATA